MADRYVVPYSEIDFSVYAKENAAEPMVSYGPSERSGWQASGGCRQIGDVTVCTDVFQASQSVRQAERVSGLSGTTRALLYEMSPYLQSVERVSGLSKAPVRFDPYSFNQSDTVAPAYYQERPPQPTNAPSGDRPNPPLHDPSLERPPGYYRDGRPDPYSYHQGGDNKAPNYYEPPSRDPYSYHPGAPEQYRPVPPPPQPEVRPAQPQPEVRPAQPDCRPCPPCRPERQCQPCISCCPCRPRGGCGWYPGKVLGGAVRRAFGGRCR